MGGRALRTHTALLSRRADPQLKLFLLMAHLLGLHHFPGGMPDLLLWHAGRRAAKLAEVKGPRDRLSDQQRAWMAALTGGTWRVHCCGA